MRIVIIGAGIAGLSSYLFFTKHLADGNAAGPHDIKIFETYDIRQTKDNTSSSEDSIDDATHPSRDEPISTPRIIGSAIGIGKNGLAVLGRIDEKGELLDRLKRRGNCILKWNMGTARGSRLVDAIVESSPGEKDEQKLSQPTVMIARQAMWEILRDRVLEVDANAVTTAKVVTISSASSGPVTVVLEDGSEHVADLVIGADGIKSEVRRTMFEHTNDTEPQSWWERLIGRTPHFKDYITPRYEGLTGVGGIVPSDVLKQAGFESGAMAITFGPNGFFGHGYISPDTDVNSSTTSTKNPPLAAWWSTFSSANPYPFQTTTPGTDNSRPTKPKLDKEAALQALNTRHSSWQDPVIHALLTHVTKNNAVDHIYPTFTTPELPTWHKGNLVLIGDAAHALQPSSGQGACQALEDAECLALLLSKYLQRHTTSTTHDNDNDKAAITSTLTKFDQLRKPRLAKIYAQSQKFGKMKGDMNVVQEYLMYFFIWLGNKMGGWKEYNDGVFEYDLVAEVEKAVS